jgi:hypothetical protein
VKQQVGVFGELYVILETTTTPVSVPKLIVCQENETLSIFLELIAQSDIRMAEIDMRNLHRTYLEDDRTGSRVVDRRIEVFKKNGEKGACHGFREKFLDVALSSGASHEVNGRILLKKRFKKWEPKDVVPVGMCKNKIQVLPLFLHESVAQSPYARSRVDDNYLIIFRPYFQTSCIAAILDKLSAGDRYGTASPIAANYHFTLSFSSLKSSQKEKLNPQ